MAKNLTRVAILLGAVVLAAVASFEASAQVSRRSNVESASQKEALEAYWSIVDGAPEKYSAFSPNAANALYRALYFHPVASTQRLTEYDPDGAIGFCFGRDMTAFLLARQMGLKVEAMKSLFIIGDLRSTEKPEWRFHVTKLVRLSDNTWWAIDPIVPQARPLPVAHWIQTVRSIWDKKGKAKLYVAPPVSVLPDVRKMQMPEQETGRDIIELSFDPTNKPGLQATRLFEGQGVKDVVYELSDEAAKRYFLSTNEAPADNFTFDKLHINDLTFDFRGYFFDLFEELLENPNPLSPLASPQALTLEKPEAFARGQKQSQKRKMPESRFGMRFDREFYQKLARSKKTGSRK